MFEWKNKTIDQIVRYVIGNQGRLENVRRLYEDLWDLIVRVFRPRRYNILGNRARGEQYGSDLYDQAPANTLNKFVRGKVANLVNESVPWLQFVTSNQRLMQLDHVKEYCQNAAEQVLSAAKRSNFYETQVPHGLDAHSIGTSVLVPMYDELDDIVAFDLVHPKDSYIATDMFGRASVYHRTLFLTGMTAVERFGADNLPENWFNTGQDGSKELREPFTEHEFIWGVYPNNDRDLDSLLPIDRPWITFCVCKEGKGEGRLVETSGLNRFPVCWRSLRESGSDYGTSLCADCLTAALVVNKLGEKAIQAAHLLVEQPKIASSSLRSSLVKASDDTGGIRPGSTVWVSDINREGVKTWMDKLNWPITDAQMERIHAQIEDPFSIRFFEMLSAADLKARTAYEVSQMMGEKATLMSTIIGAYERKSLEPQIMFLADIEGQAGRMPDIPEEIIAEGGKIDIHYLGPLAQLQRSLLRSKGIIDSVSLLLSMRELSEEVAWKFNWPEIAEEAAVSTGMPQKHVLSDDEFNKLRDAIMAQREAMQQAQMAAEAAKAVPGLSKKAESGSPMAQLQEAGV